MTEQSPDPRNPNNDENPSSHQKEPSNNTQNINAPSTGIAGNVEGNQNINIDNSSASTRIQQLVQIIKKPINIAVAGITATVGMVGIIFAGKQNFNFGGINVGGNVESGATVAIYKNDPPEVRKRKLEQAKRLIAQEVLTNIANLDARLGYTEAALLDDGFEEQLRKQRNQVAPSLDQIFDSGYRRIIRQQQISSLRGAFNSRPLNEVQAPLIQVLVDGNADPERVRAFYNNLDEVRDVSESLFQELATASQASTDPKVISHHKKRIKLAVERLMNRSQIAYLSGLMVLDSLQIPLPEAQDRLNAFQYLEPRRLISQHEASQLLAEQVKEMERLLAERAAIVEEAKTLRDSKLDEYSKINESLIINPSDPWNVVVGKAISLRQLGRTTEAVAAFSRYGEMFAEKDPTAAQYSRTAQQFTLQISNLNVQGGVYLYDIVQSGAANQSGLRVGDILIGYADKNIMGMEAITTALRDAPAGKPVQLIYLRMNNAGEFQRQTITINAGPLGVNMMPI